MKKYVKVLQELNPLPKAITPNFLTLCSIPVRGTRVQCVQNYYYLCNYCPHEWRREHFQWNFIILFSWNETSSICSFLNLFYAWNMIWELFCFVLLVWLHNWRTLEMNLCNYSLVIPIVPFIRKVLLIICIFEPIFHLSASFPLELFPLYPSFHTNLLVLSFLTVHFSYCETGIDLTALFSVLLARELKWNVLLEFYVAGMRFA